MRLAPGIVLAILALAGCRAGEGDHAAPQATAAPSPTAGAGEAASDAGVTMRYQCGAGGHVEVLGADAARVTLADGRVVRIPRVAGSAPPAFAGEALAFAIGEGGAQLSQDEGGHWDCSAG